MKEGGSTDTQIPSGTKTFHLLFNFSSDSYLRKKEKDPFHSSLIKMLMNTVDEELYELYVKGLCHFLHISASGACK